MKDKDKQIKEIFKDLCEAPIGAVNEDFTIGTMKDSHTDLCIRTIAGHLYAKDYRKTEWISVRDRLPNKDELVLCIGAKGGMFLGTHLYLCKDKIRANAIVPNSPCGRYAIYWMPLPEAPDMKGE